jgi:hypothetical protein
METMQMRNLIPSPTMRRAANDIKHSSFPIQLLPLAIAVISSTDIMSSHTAEAMMSVNLAHSTDY